METPGPTLGPIVVVVAAFVGIWLLLVAVIWLISRIDLLPEFLPGIGPLDDIVAAAVILGWIGRQTGRARLEEHWPGDAAGFAVVARMLRLPAE